MSAARRRFHAEQPSRQVAQLVEFVHESGQAVKEESEKGVVVHRAAPGWGRQTIRRAVQQPVNTLRLYLSGRPVIASGAILGRRFPSLLVAGHAGHPSTARQKESPERRWDARGWLHSALAEPKVPGAGPGTVLGGSAQQ